MSSIILPVQTMTITNLETNEKQETKVYTLPENLTAEELNNIFRQLTK